MAASDFWHSPSTAFRDHLAPNSCHHCHLHNSGHMLHGLPDPLVAYLADTYSHRRHPSETGMDFYFDSPETLANPFADVLAPPRAKGTPTPSAVSTSPAPSVSFSSSVFYDLHPLLVWPPAVSCSPAALAGSSSQQQQPHASTVVEPEVEVQFDLQLLKQRPGNCAMELLLLQGEQLLARQRVSGTIGLNKCR